MHRQLNSLPVAIVAATTVLMPLAASAQVSDPWQFGAQIYAYLPSLQGTANFPGSGSTSSISVDADTLLENLNFVFFGSFEAKKGRWGAFTDLMYVNVGDNKSGIHDFTVGGTPIPGTASASVNYDLKGWIWTIAAEYVAVAQPGATMDVFAGARMLDLEQEINWGLAGDIGGIPGSGRSGASSVGRTNWDGIVGIKGRWRFGDDFRWFVPYYVDVGTGDSDLTWQAMAGLGYSWKSVDVFAAWRYLDYDLGEGKPFTTLSFNGPLVAVAFRW